MSIFSKAVRSAYQLRIFRQSDNHIEGSSIERYS